MPGQAEVQAGFARALFSGAVPEGFGAEGEARFAVYRNNVLHGLSKVLASRFPVLRAMMGERPMLALARSFVMAHPPRTPILADWGAALPDYLEALPDLTAFPYLADVARLEWARGEAWGAADAAPVSPEALARAAMAPERRGLGLHPSVRLVNTRHAAFSIWAAHQGGGPLAGIDPYRPEATLALRDPSLQVQTLPLAPADAGMLAALMAGETLLAAMGAAGPGHDPAGLFTTLARHGAIIAITGEDHDDSSAG